MSHDADALSHREKAQHQNLNVSFFFCLLLPSGGISKQADIPDTHNVNISRFRAFTISLLL